MGASLKSPKVKIIFQNFICIMYQLRPCYLDKMQSTIADNPVYEITTPGVRV